MPQKLAGVKMNVKTTAKPPGKQVTKGAEIKLASRKNNSSLRAPRVQSRAEQQRAQDTRASLVATARKVFGEVGYHASATEDLVALANVSRGALYHHFKNKEDLFETVYRQVALELAEDAQSATLAMTGKTWPRAIATLRVYLELLAMRRDVQRILLIDGPAVLGWERWRALRSEFEFGGWVRTLSLLADQGQIVKGPIGPLAQIIVAAIDEAILAVAHARDTEKTLADMTEALAVLIGGLIQVRRD